MSYVNAVSLGADLDDMASSSVRLQHEHARFLFPTTDNRRRSHVAVVARWQNAGDPHGVADFGRLMQTAHSRLSADIGKVRDDLSADIGKLRDDLSGDIGSCGTTWVPTWRRLMTGCEPSRPTWRPYARSSSVLRREPQAKRSRHTLPRPVSAIVDRQSVFGQYPVGPSIRGSSGAAGHAGGADRQVGN